MRPNRIFRKEFFITLFIYSVLVHTLMVVYHAVKAKQSWLFKEKMTDFTNHEEVGYQMIKNVPFISDYTKNLVRYHFLIRGMDIAQRKGYDGRHKRMKRIYESLDESFVEDLKLFLKFDDLAKV